MSNEFNAALELLEMLVLSPRTGVLMVLLLAAAFSDIKTGRIPNWLVLGGVLYGLAYNAFFPLYPRDIGILFALGGLAVGLVAFLPLYLLRAMGAGDVKLMAMVGAFLGTTATIACVMATFVAGGLLAIAFALRSRLLSRMLANVAASVRGTVLNLAVGVREGLMVDQRASAGKMPYGVAIAFGTIGYLLAAQLGYLPYAWS